MLFAFFVIIYIINYNRVKNNLYIIIKCYNKYINIFKKKNTLNRINVKHLINYNKKIKFLLFNMLYLMFQEKNHN